MNSCASGSSRQYVTCLSKSRSNRKNVLAIIFGFSALYLTPSMRTLYGYEYHGILSLNQWHKQWALTFCGIRQFFWNFRKSIPYCRSQFSVVSSCQRFECNCRRHVIDHVRIPLRFQSVHVRQPCKIDLTDSNESSWGMRQEIRNILASKGHIIDAITINGRFHLYFEYWCRHPTLSGILATVEHSDQPSAMKMRGKRIQLNHSWRIQCRYKHNQSGESEWQWQNNKIVEVYFDGKN